MKDNEQNLNGLSPSRRIPKLWKTEIETNGSKALKYLAVLEHTPDKVTKSSSGIGDRLHLIIKRETGNDVQCSACKAEIE